MSFHDTAYHQIFFLGVLHYTEFRSFRDLTLAKELHEVLSHAGRDKTIEVMYSRYAHPQFPRVITEVVRTCMPCQSHKGNISKQYPILRRKVSKPFELFAVDLMDLPRTRKGNKTILVGIDLYTKYGYAVPLKCKKSHIVAKALESHILATVPRTPEVLLSDNGPEFRAGYFQKLMHKYGIRHEYSVPYAPCTNGGVERFNQTVKSRLATVCHGEPEKWDKQLPGVVAQYNRSPHGETGKAPADFFVTDNKINVPTSPYWKYPSKFTPFVVGDLIMRKVPYQTPGESSKLHPKYQGPLQIVKADPNGVTYRAKFLMGQCKEVNVHISQIKKFHGKWESPVIAPQASPVPQAQAPKRKVPTNYVPTNDVFQLNFDDFSHIPLTIEPPIIGPMEPPNLEVTGGLEPPIIGPMEPPNLESSPDFWNPPNFEEFPDFSGFPCQAPLSNELSTPSLSVNNNNHEDGENIIGNGASTPDQLVIDPNVNNDSNDSDFMNVSPPFGSTPSLLLPGNLGNEVGSWEVQPDLPAWSVSPVEQLSPTASEVVSEHCIPAPVASTPTHQRQQATVDVSDMEPPPAPRRMTRAQARRDEGIPVPAINYRDVSNSYEMESSIEHGLSVLRGEVCSKEFPIEISLPEDWPKLSVSVHTTHPHYHLFHTITRVPKDT